MQTFDAVGSIACNIAYGCNIVLFAYARGVKRRALRSLKLPCRCFGEFLIVPDYRLLSLVIIINSSVIYRIVVMYVIVVHKLHSRKHINASRSVGVVLIVGNINSRVINVKHLKKALSLGSPGIISEMNVPVGYSDLCYSDKHNRNKHRTDNSFFHDFKKPPWLLSAEFRVQNTEVVIFVLHSSFCVYFKLVFLHIETSIAIISSISFSMLLNSLSVR